VQRSTRCRGLIHLCVTNGADGRSISPSNYVVAFPLESGPQRYHSALLSLRIVSDRDIHEETAGGVAAHLHMIGRTLERLGGDSGQSGSESIEFELLSKDAPVQPLRFTAGPVRVNAKGQRESMRLDLGDCVRRATPDTVEGMVDGVFRQLVRQRWWVGLETLRLVCIANSLECRLDTPGELEWVACLVDDRRQAGSAPEQTARGEDAAKPKAKKKKKESTACSVPAAAPPASVPPAAQCVSGAPPSAEPAKEAPPQKQLPKPASRTLALPSALVDSWCQFTKKNVTHVAEASGFVHFDVSMDETRKRVVQPAHYIIAFPRDKRRFHSSLLSLRNMSDVDSPGVDYVEFELLSRVHEAPGPLTVTAGPVRSNPETGQRESMRIDLGRCLREITTDIVDVSGKRFVRNRWWISIETLRLVCTANNLSCSALDAPSCPPVEWVTCLVDKRVAVATAPQEEERDIDDLVEFIGDDLVEFMGGKAGSKKKKKKKEKDKEKDKVVDEPGLLQRAPPAAVDPAWSQPAAKPRTDPVANVQAAAQLLAEAAASCTSPEQAAAASVAAEAARRAAEAVGSAPPNVPSRHVPRGHGAGPLGSVGSSVPRPAAARVDERRLPSQLYSGPSCIPVGQTSAPFQQGRRPKPDDACTSGTFAWEPTQRSDVWGQSQDFSIEGSIGSPTAFDGLESLLAGLRSEFAEVGHDIRCDIAE